MSTEDEGDTLEPKYEELYVHEILEGKPASNFPGIISLIRHFMVIQDYNEAHK